MKRKTTRPEGWRVGVYARGAGLRYDLPEEVIKQLRLANVLRNLIVQRHRDLDCRCQEVKEAGGDHKAFRKEFIAKYGRPDDPEWVKATYRRLRLGSALATEVVKRLADANAALIEKRKAGEKAEFGPRNFDGTGTTYKQIKTGDAGGTPIEQIEVKGGGGLRIERNGRHAIFHLTVYPGARLAIPIPNYYRQRPNGKDRIPDGAIVTAVRISRRREGRHFRVSVAVTYWTPETPPPPDAPPLVLVSGWASEAGAVRVANLSGALIPPSPPPAELLVHGWVYPDGEGGYEIELPEYLRKRMEHTDAIRSFRDEELDRVRPLLAEATGRPQWAAKVRSAERVHRVVRGLDPGPLVAELEKWRREDAHHWDYEAGQRGQILNRKRDAWRKVAAWIASQDRPVRITKPAVARIRKVKPTDSYAAKGGRRNIQQAAPAELVAQVITACQIRGVPYEEGES